MEAETGWIDRTWPAGFWRDSEGEGEEGEGWDGDAVGENEVGIKIRGILIGSLVQRREEKRGREWNLAWLPPSCGSTARNCLNSQLSSVEAERILGIRREFRREWI